MGSAIFMTENLQGTELNKDKELMPGSGKLS
jgi:hypothetical protein